MTAVIDFWDHIADDYFVRYDADAIAWHAKMIIRTSAVTLPLVTARHTIDVGANQFLICAPDAEDLLLRATSGFDRLRLNIVDARIHTTRTGLSLMTCTGHSVPFCYRYFRFNYIIISFHYHIMAGKTKSGAMENWTIF